jgi:hypothetical protein
MAFRHPAYQKWLGSLAQGRMKICDFQAYEREIGILNWTALHGCKASRRAVRYFWCWMRLLVIKSNFVGAARRTLAIDRQEGGFAVELSLLVVCGLNYMTTKEHCPISFQLSLPFWPQRINHFRCFTYNAPYVDSHMFIILTP